LHRVEPSGLAHRSRTSDRRPGRADRRALRPVAPGRLRNLRRDDAPARSHDDLVLRRRRAGLGLRAQPPRRADLPVRAGSAGTLTALLLALACSSAAAPSATGAPPYTGRIVFDAGISDPPGDIYTMNADGTHLRRLTRNDHGEYAPRWSPDGGRIAFVREIF